MHTVLREGPGTVVSKDVAPPGTSHHSLVIGARWPPGGAAERAKLRVVSQKPKRGRHARSRTAGSPDGRSTLVHTVEVELGRRCDIAGTTALLKAARVFGPGTFTVGRRHRRDSYKWGRRGGHAALGV